jgi:hypothetical protein
MKFSAYEYYIERNKLLIELENSVKSRWNNLNINEQQKENTKFFSKLSSTFTELDVCPKGDIITKP